MKTHYKTLWAAGLVSLLIAFTVFDGKRTEKSKEADEKATNLLLLPLDEVVRVELSPRGQTSIALEKIEGEWALQSPLREPADNQEVRNLLLSIQAEKSRETVAEGPGTDLKTYGLDQPPVEVSLTAKDGAREKIKIGAVKAMDESLYAQVNDQPKVLLVSSSWDFILSKRLAEFRNKNLYRRSPAKPDEVDRLEIVQQQPGFPARLILEREGEKWNLREGDRSFPLSSGRVDSYISTLKALRAQDFHAENKEQPGTLAKFKLLPPAIEVRFLRKGAPQPFYKLALSAPDARGDAFAVSTDFAQVVSIFKAAAEPVYRRSDDFFAKKLPFKFDPKEAAGIKVETPMARVEYRKQDGAWFLGEKKLADGAKIDGVLERLAGAEALRIFEPGPEPSGKKISTINVQKADGSSLFHLVFGPERIVRARNSVPEAKYILAKTNLSDRLLGLPEKTIEGFGLSAIANESEKGQHVRDPN